MKMRQFLRYYICCNTATVTIVIDHSSCNCSYYLEEQGVQIEFPRCNKYTQKKGGQQICDVLLIEVFLFFHLKEQWRCHLCHLIVAFQIQVAVKSISNNLFLSERLCLKIDIS